jgi:hypothetical protein
MAAHFIAADSVMLSMYLCLWWMWWVRCCMTQLV